MLEHLFIPGRSVRYVVLPDRVDGAAALTAHETRLDNALLEYRRRKRQGKYLSREEQIKQVEKKQAKLAAEMELEAQQQQQQQLNALTAADDSAAAGEFDEEPHAKRPRHESSAVS